MFPALKNSDWASRPAQGAVRCRVLWGAGRCAGKMLMNPSVSSTGWVWYLLQARGTGRHCSIEMLWSHRQIWDKIQWETQGMQEVMKQHLWTSYLWTREFNLNTVLNRIGTGCCALVTITVSEILCFFQQPTTDSVILKMKTLQLKLGIRS